MQKKTPLMTDALVETVEAVAPVVEPDLVTTPAVDPPAPVLLPEVDGGGDQEMVIYVDDARGTVVPYAAQARRARVVSVAGTPYEHVAERPDGTWVYRA